MFDLRNDSTSFRDNFDIDGIHSDMLYHLSSTLSGVRKIAGGLNCRCPICGDSKKSRSKRRGYILKSNRRGDTSYGYYCHNCNYSNSLMGFFKEIDQWTYQRILSDNRKVQFKKVEKRKPLRANTGEYEYIRVNKVTSNTNKFEQEELTQVVPPREIHTHDLRDKYNIYCLTDDVSNIPQLQRIKDVILRYVEKRKLPIDKYHKLYYSIDLYKSYLMIQRDLKVPYDERIKLVGETLRLITLVVDPDNPTKVLSMSCRDILGKSDRRYLILKTLAHDDLLYNDPLCKVFNLDEVEIDKPVIVVEGALDCLFLENSIAIQGGDVSALRVLLDMFVDPELHDNFIIALDNDNIEDTRNRNIKSKKLGFNVLDWSKFVLGGLYKDINDMIKSGYITVIDIMKYIYRQCYFDKPQYLTRHRRQQRFIGELNYDIS